MKLSQIKFVVFFLFLIVQISFSQSETVYKGKVLCNNFPIEKVELINLNTEKSSFSNNAGEFSIIAKPKDIIVFVSKLYEVKRIEVDQNTIDNNNLIISLILKPEQLEEVVITKIPSIKWEKDTKWEQEKLDQLALEKVARTPKILGINNGTIENGMDFMRIGGMIFGLFAKEKEKIKISPLKIEFIALAKTRCNQKFYIETLNLKQEEIELFLQFCNADSKSKMVAQNNNTLVMMNFLFAKNHEFKKLKP
ncbi:MAG: hypothetical protein RL308_2692 [Bacteroidota bacterium]|jgi:hypothetical protein